MFKQRLLTTLACSAFIFAVAASGWGAQVAPQDTGKKYCSNWTAWRDSQPTNKPTLHVRGKCVFPTTGYSVKLRPAESPSLNQNIYLLDLVIHIPVDKSRKRVVKTPVAYSEQTDKVYTHVQIMPDDVKVEVREISASTSETKTPKNEETISGCVYSIQDCTVFITKDGKYYHLSGPADEVAKAKAAKTVVRVEAKPGTWEEGSASCKSEHVKPIVIGNTTVTRMRCAPTAPAAGSRFNPTGAAQRIRNFTSTTDRNGNQHPVTADVHSNGVIKCTSAAGNNPQQYPPACFVLGQILPPGQTAGTGAGGSMTLTCNGQAPLKCTIQITD